MITFAYDAMGRLIKDAGPSGGLWSLLRADTATGHSVTMSSAMGRSKTYLVGNPPAGGEVITNTDPNGLVTKKTTRADGTLTVAAPDGTITTTVRGPDPRWGMQSPVTASETVKLPSGLAYAASVKKAVVLATPGNQMSLTKETTTATVNGKTSTTVFDATAKTITATSPAGRQAVATLDAKGKVTREATGGLAPVSYAYDARGRLTGIGAGSGVDARSSAIAYGADGNVASVTDPLGGIIGYAYDGAGRVMAKTLKDGRVIGFTYDANGNVTSITPPSRPAHGFNYTAADQESAYMPPNVGGASATLYSYNLDKQVTLISRPDGQAVGISYDNGGRESVVITPTSTITHAYSPSTGKLVSVVTSDGQTVNYGYDGFLTTSLAWSGVVNGNVGFSYNNDFHVSALSIGGYGAIPVSYDPDGLIVSAGAMTISHSAQNGLATSAVVGGITTTYGYNQFGEMTSERSTANGAVVHEALYTRDNLGRITKKVMTAGGVAKTHSYLYDTAGRLAQASIDGVVIASYACDANGNRLGKTDAVGTVAGVYDAQDRLMNYGANSYAYTANGELLTKTNPQGVFAYNYDALGNLRSVRLANGTLVEYVIDGANRRVGKKVDGVLTQGLLYASQLKPVAELDGAGNVVSVFVYGTKTNVPDYMVKNGVTYRIISDHLGSPVMVLDASTGVVVQQITYDEFGVVLADSNPGFQPFGFAGGLYDKDTGLVRFGARDYDAESGRWTGKDPILFKGGDTNLYGYVLNDPVSLIDPSGLYWIYYQSSGNLWWYDEKTGECILMGKGYSGKGPDKNKPDSEDKKDKGPIPRGPYEIGKDNGKRGPLSLPLTPVSGKNPYGRDGFLIHGDNGKGDQSASTGCIILGLGLRQDIANSGDNLLIVR